MLVEEVVDHLKVHEERFPGYKNKEEKCLLLTHDEWLAWTQKKDVADSSFLGTRGCDSHNKENKGRGRGSRGGHDNNSQIHDNANPGRMRI